jgi:hypothetical protein
MKFLKGFGTFICSFLLFLALSSFGFAYMLNSTILSSNFVDKQINKVNISSIARDVVKDQIADKLPSNSDVLKEVALNVFETKEPWIKAQLTGAVDSGYNYFLGKTDTLKISVSLVELKATLSSDFVNAAKDYLNQQMSAMSEAQKSQYLQDFIREFPASLLPPQLAALPQSYQKLAVEEYLREFTGQKPLTGLPVQITGLVDKSARQYFTDFLADFTSEIKDSYSIDQSTIDAKTMDSISTVKKAIGYFRSGYPWLIVFMVLMAALIFLINRNLKITARTLGVDLILFGVLDLVGSIVSRLIMPTQFLTNSSIPVSVQNVIDNVYKDVTSIMLTFSIVVLVIGVVFLVASFFFKKKEIPA